MAEQRYQTVQAVIRDGLSVTQTPEKARVSRQTVHGWLARYEAEGLDVACRPNLACPLPNPTATNAVRSDTLDVKPRRALLGRPERA